MLEAGARRAAEHEDKGRDHGAGRVPATPLEQRHEGEGAGQKVREDDEVEQLHRGLVHEPAEKQHRGCEEQRLGIGHGRMAAEMIGVPERQLAVLEGGAEIAQHRVEMVLRVPGHDGAGEGPGSRGDRPGGEDREEREPRLARRPGGGPGGVRHGVEVRRHGWQAAAKEPAFGAGTELGLAAPRPRALALGGCEAISSIRLVLAGGVTPPIHSIPAFPFR